MYSTPTLWPAEQHVQITREETEAERWFLRARQLRAQVPVWTDELPAQALLGQGPAAAHGSEDALCLNCFVLMQSQHQVPLPHDALCVPELVPRVSILGILTGEA